MDAYQLQAVALGFRDSILKIPPNQRPIGLQQFPFGACGDTSLLIGTHLNAIGELGFQYVSGIRGSHEFNTWHTHAWIQRKNLVIDLTCDQFDDAPLDFVFQTSIWHKQFRETESSDADLGSWNGQSVQELLNFYSMIKDRL